MKPRESFLWHLPQLSASQTNARLSGVPNLQTREQGGDPQITHLGQQHSVSAVCRHCAELGIETFVLGEMANGAILPPGLGEVLRQGTRETEHNGPFTGHPLGFSNRFFNP